MDIHRRNWLRGRFGTRAAVPKLPWLKSPVYFFDHCTKCHVCADACPVHILVTDSDGFPGADFRRGECTFCGTCADVCPERLFNSDRTTAPWDLVGAIGGSCLTLGGVSCRCCEDSCEVGAIRFRPQLGGASQPRLDADSCTGCGACVAVCPVGAIDVLPGRVSQALAATSGQVEVRS